MHPLTIFANLWRVFYLIIIPVLRGFIVALQGDLANWVQGAWIDILVFLVMILLAVWRWWVVVYSYDDAEFVLDSGWLVRNQIRLPWQNITTISVIESFYLRPFRAVRLRADTIGGSAGKPDFTLLVQKAEAQQVLQRLRHTDSGERSWEYVPKNSSILALAVLTSNSFAGILFIAAFISQSGRLLGNEFNEFSYMIIGTFEEAVRMLAFGVPPAAAAIAYMLLAGWFIGFLLTLFRYKNFAVCLNHNTLDIGGGIFTNRDYCIRSTDVNFIDIRQSIVTKLLNLYSLYISVVGYAKQRDDISCVIPTENHRAFTLTRERLFPALSPTDRQIRPRYTAILRFIGVGLSWCIGIPLGMVVLIWLFPSWKSFILFVGLMSMVPALFFLVVRIVDFATGGIAKTGSNYTLRYSKGFYLHTVVIPLDKVVGIELRQSPIQQFTPNCDLIISTRAEKRYTHLCRNLDKAALQALFRL